MLSAPTIVLRLAQANRFTLAMTTAQSLSVDMTDLFNHLTIQCLRLSRNPDTVMYDYLIFCVHPSLISCNRQEDSSDWLLNDDLASWSGTPVERGWRYLRQALHQYDSAETEYKYSKATLETILGADRTSSPPPWLIHILEV